MVHSRAEDRKKKKITLRLLAKLSQIIKVNKISLKIEIMDPREEMMFQERKVSG